MHKQMDFIIVPYWVDETLRRNGLKLDDCLDFEKIRPVFSATDLAAFLATQRFWHYIVGGEQHGIDSYSLRWSWDATVRSEDNKTLLASTIGELEQSEGIVKAVIERLFNPHNKRARDEEPFIIYDIPPNAGAIVVYPGHFTEVTAENLQCRALGGILRVLYKYNTTYDEVSWTPWFKQYLRQLSKQIVA